MLDEFPIQILIVEENASVRRLCVSIARDAGLVCLQAASGREALERLAQRAPELVLTNLVMGDMSGLELLDEARHRNPLTEVALMSTFGSPESALEAIRLGAYEFIVKPFRVERLKLTLTHMAEKARLLRENTLLRSRLLSKNAWTPCTDLEELERITVQRVLAQVHGDKEKARHLLGISRATLYRKIKCYGVIDGLRQREGSGKARGSEKPVILLSQS